MAVKLVVKEEFSSFGLPCRIGDVVDPVEAAKWPGGALATRLQNGFLEYREVTDETETASDGLDAPTLVDVLAELKTKQDLVDYAKVKFSLDLSTSLTREALENEILAAAKV